MLRSESLYGFNMSGAGWCEGSVQSFSQKERKGREFRREDIRRPDVFACYDGRIMQIARIPPLLHAIQVSLSLSLAETNCRAHLSVTRSFEDRFPLRLVSGFSLALAKLWTTTKSTALFPFFPNTYTHMSTDTCQPWIRLQPRFRDIYANDVMTRKAFKHTYLISFRYINLHITFRRYTSF